MLAENSAYLPMTCALQLPVGATCIGQHTCALVVQSLLYSSGLLNHLLSQHVCSRACSDSCFAVAKKSMLCIAVHWFLCNCRAIVTAQPTYRYHLRAKKDPGTYGEQSTAVKAGLDHRTAFTMGFRVSFGMLSDTHKQAQHYSISSSGPS